MIDLGAPAAEPGYVVELTPTRLTLTKRDQAIRSERAQGEASRLLVPLLWFLAGLFAGMQIGQPLLGTVLGGLMAALALWLVNLFGSAYGQPESWSFDLKTNQVLLNERFLASTNEACGVEMLTTIVNGSPERIDVSVTFASEQSLTLSWGSLAIGRSPSIVEPRHIAQKLAFFLKVPVLERCEQTHWSG